MTDNKQNVNPTSVFFVLCSLFFMWGFITVLNFGLLEKWAEVYKMGPFQAFYLTMVFFLVYFVMAIPAGRIINKLGFRNGIITGIFVAGIGCLAMFPAVSMGSFETLAIALFIMASGITILQVAANPYVVMMGSGPARLSLCGGFNSLGAILATFITEKVSGKLTELYSNLSPDEIIQTASNFIKMPYLILGGVWLVVGVILLFSNLPKIFTHEMEPLVKEKTGRPFKSVTQFSHLILGVLAIFVYVGVEVGIAQYLGKAETMANMMSGTEVFKFVKYYWVAAMVGRFIGAMLLSRINAAQLNTIYAVIASILIVIFMLSINSDGNIPNSNAFYALVVLGFLHSIMWPVIFSQAIDGLGKFTEEGSSLLIMAVAGGAVLPFIFYLMSSTSIFAAFGVYLAAYLFIGYYTLKGYKYEKK